MQAKSFSEERATIIVTYLFQTDQSNKDVGIDFTEDKT